MAKIEFPISISVLDTDIMRDIIEILKQITNDERIALDVREEYIRAIDSTAEEHSK